MRPKPMATNRATSSRRPATAMTAAIASSRGAATSPSKATVTAITADTAEAADQICRTVLATPGSRSPTSTTARSAAARPAAINAATVGGSAADAHSTGSTPAVVSSAITTLLPVDGSRISAPAMARTAAIPQAPASQASLPSPKAAAASATRSGKVDAVILAACNRIQSLPSWTSSDAAEIASMNAIRTSVMPSVTIGASTISGTSTSSPRCCESQRRAKVRPPPPITAAITKPTGADTQS